MRMRMCGPTHRVEGGVVLAGALDQQLQRRQAEVHLGDVCIHSVYSVCVIYSVCAI